MGILHDELLKIARRDTARFHMPGHKGKPQGTGLDGALFVDFTEIDATGDLYGEQDDIIKAAERRVAQYYGAAECLFLTCGATQGVKAMLGTFVGSGTLLLDRNTHKSVIDGCALLGITPTYICPKYDVNLGITGDFELGELEKKLLEMPEIEAFLVTSPTYYGKCLDVEKILNICRAHGVKLLVDSAHGGHLKSAGEPDPVSQGADCVVFSPHKTMGALTQGGYLLLKDSEHKKKARQMTALFGTSSPSYVIMSTLDMAGEFAAKNAEKSRQVSEYVKNARYELEKMGFISPFLGDPHRIVLNCQSMQKNAWEIAKKMAEHGVVCEMCDGQNIVFIATMYDVRTDVEKLLEGALKAISEVEMSGEENKKNMEFPPLPACKMSPRDAYMSVHKSLCSLRGAVGKISAQSVYLYPPGVPFVIPGELIDEKLLEYLQQVRYNVSAQIYIVEK